MRWLTASARWTSIVLVTSLVLLPGSVAADGPPVVPYQGFLTNAAGQPIDTAQNMTFRFFSEATGGASLFAESKNVAVEDGVFQTNIGDTSTQSTRFW